jgi:hypothetical protein
MSLRRIKLSIYEAVTPRGGGGGGGRRRMRRRRRRRRRDGVCLLRDRNWTFKYG